MPTKRHRVLLLTAAVGLAVGIGVLIVAYVAAPVAERAGISQAFVFASLMLFALVAALITVGVLRSRAEVEGSAFGQKVSLGGGAAVFLLVLLGGMRATEQGPPPSFTLLAQFRDSDSQPLHSGSATLLLAGESRDAPIDTNGTARFPNLPAALRGTNAHFMLRAPCYVLLDAHATHPLSDMLTIPVSRLPFAWTRDTSSEVYHRDGCSTVQTILPANLVCGATPPPGRRLHLSENTSN